MAKADYIHCDVCDAKIVYDGDETIINAIDALGLAHLPRFCVQCRSDKELTYAFRVVGKSLLELPPSFASYNKQERFAMTAKNIATLASLVAAVVSVLCVLAAVLLSR